MSYLYHPSGRSCTLHQAQGNNGVSSRIWNGNTNCISKSNKTRTSRRTKSTRISIGNGRHITDSTSCDTGTSRKLSALLSLRPSLFLLRSISPTSLLSMISSLRRLIQSPPRPVSSLLHWVPSQVLLRLLRLLLPLPLCQPPDLVWKDHFYRVHLEDVQSPSSMAPVIHLNPLWPQGVFRLVTVTITSGQWLLFFNLAML
jgi:hypothetical protein